jgi:hypothetical protein
MFRHANECIRLITNCCGADDPMIQEFEKRKDRLMESIATSVKRTKMLEESRRKLTEMSTGKDKGKMTLKEQETVAEEQDEVRDDQKEGKQEWEIIGRVVSIEEETEIKTVDGNIFEKLAKVRLLED